MQTKSNENVGPPESRINGPDFGSSSGSQEIALSEPSDQPKRISLDDSQSFYDKLYGVYEPNGVNLVLNVRETLLNLHDFYKEVTERGGYSQVEKEKRWGEVSAAMNLRGTESNLLSQQLRRIYAVFLFHFEQLYFRRSSQGNKGKKSMDLDPIEEANNKAKDTGPRIRAKGKSQKPGPQKRTRTAYHIFLKRECERLRGSQHERPVGQSYRPIADDAWRNLSELDRQPYIDESNKEREIFCREIEARMEAKNGKVPEDVYHVLPEFDAEPSGRSTHG